MVFVILSTHFQEIESSLVKGIFSLASFHICLGSKKIVVNELICSTIVQNIGTIQKLYFISIYTSDHVGMAENDNVTKHLPSRSC